MNKCSTEHPPDCDTKRRNMDKHLPAATGHNSADDNEKAENHAYYRCDVHKAAIPQPLLSISGKEPQLLETTGQPQAMASKTGKPKPSLKEGWQ